MRIVALTLVFSLLTNRALAWDQDGHAIVAELAQRHMSRVPLTNLKVLLKGEVSLASISSWADDVRSGRKETYNWHFVDMPRRFASGALAR